MWCELPPPKSILPMGPSPPAGPWSMRAGRFQALLSWEWFILLWTPDNLPSEVLRSHWQGCCVRGCLSTPQWPPVWTECHPLPQGRGHSYTTWPVSMPQLIGPGWTADPNQANWVLCPGNPTLGPKGIDFKCFEEWLDASNVGQPPALECGGHRWRMRGWWGRVSCP